MVIMVLLALMSIGLFTNNKMNEWKLGRAASETLRSVYSAQRMYLADNPTAQVANLTDALLIPYLPNQNNSSQPLPQTLIAAFSPIKPITGGDLGFSITASPPYLTQGGVRYDPSGSFTDSLWDVGQ